MGNDPFVDAAESASFPLPGTGKREGGEKTPPSLHVPSGYICLLLKLAHIPLRPMPVPSLKVVTINFR